MLEVVDDLRPEERNHFYLTKINKKNKDIYMERYNVLPTIARYIIHKSSNPYRAVVSQSSEEHWEAKTVAYNK